LTAQGFQTWEAPSRQDLPELLRLRSWSLVLLDIENAGPATLARCREIREQFEGPIAIVSAQLDDLDRVRVLQTGVDEEIAWPIHQDLLGARLHALLRRTPPVESARNAPSPPRKIGALCLDSARQEVLYQGRRILLTPLEFDLLDLLARHAGQPVSREEICIQLRGLIYDPRDRSIDLRISRLRRKMGDDCRAPALVLTIRGIGYQLSVDPL
jgi:two-component system response regulator RstA